MIHTITRPVHWLINRMGYRVEKLPPWTVHPDYPADYDAEEIATIQAVRPYTMTSSERVVTLVRSLHYLVANGVPGDVVECGVWKGGSMMAAARTLRRLGDAGRGLWLYDTFSGMTEPGAADVSALDGDARDIYKSCPQWCRASLEEVRANICATGYDERKVRFVPGKVEETIPGQGPETIALLRLDTDWYESTRHEMIHLFPRLARGGVLIIDDYGHWEGARRAVDEYVKENKVPLLLNRIDTSARVAVKL